MLGRKRQDKRSVLLLIDRSCILNDCLKLGNCPCFEMKYLEIVTDLLARMGQDLDLSFLLHVHVLHRKFDVNASNRQSTYPDLT